MNSSALNRVWYLMNVLPRELWLTAVVIFVASLFYFGAQPIAVGLFAEPYDKVAHFCAFGVLTGLLWLGTGGRWPAAVLLVAAGIGGLDEIHQIWLPGRVADIKDFVADCCGVACVAIALHSRAAAARAPSAPPINLK